jgi:hypothetical protein
MLLDDIQKRATKMSHAELRERIEDIRRGRIQTVKQVEKTHRTTKKTQKKTLVAIAKKLGLTKEQLIAELGLDDTESKD